MRSHTAWILLATSLVAAACGPAGVDGERMRRIAYGDGPSQIAELSLPAGGDEVPLVVLLHGGFWLRSYRLGLMDPLADDLLDRGYGVYNLEYRRVGGAGGWPETFRDVATGMDHLAEIGEPRLRLDRVVVVGHSAGGHLALWAAARGALPAGVTGADPTVEPCAVVGQAAVSDLSAAAAQHLGGGAAVRLMGGTPAEVPDRYDLADPARRLPIPVPVLLVHGAEDTLVPPQMSRDFADAGRAAGGRIDLEEVAGDHFVHLDPGAAAWTAVVRWMREAGCDG